MQRFPLPETQLIEPMPPSPWPAQMSERSEESDPKYRSLDSLPLELLRPIIKQVAPKSIFDMQRTLARLAMVNRQLRFSLLRDMRQTMWIHSADQVDEADKIPQEYFDSATTLIVTNEPSYVERTRGTHHGHDLRKPNDLSGPDIEGLIQRLPRLRTLRLADSFYLSNPVEWSSLSSWMILRMFTACDTTSHADCRQLSSLFIKDTQVYFILRPQAEPVRLDWTQLAFVGNSYWFQYESESFLCTSAVYLPFLRTLRLGVVYFSESGFKIPEISPALLAQLEAVQLGIGSPNTAALLALPECYLKTTTPVLLDLSLLSRGSIVFHQRRMRQFEYVQIGRIASECIPAIWTVLRGSTRLRAVFISKELVEMHDATGRDRNLVRRLIRKLEIALVEVVLCDSDEDEFILPEFLEHIKERQRMAERA